MNTSTIIGAIVTACLLLISGMAALIKTMVVGKLDALQKSLDDMRDKHHALDARVIRLEAQHEHTHPHRRSGDE